MRTRPSLLLTPLLTLAIASGCNFAFDISGDWTDGERGRSRWQIDDGLCPGFGGCALDVPVVSGANTELNIEVPGYDPRALTFASEGPATVELSRLDVEHEQLDLGVLSTGPGVLGVELFKDGELLDRAELRFRDPATLDCGVAQPGEALRYTMEAMTLTAEASTHLDQSLNEDGEVLELACLVTDAEGRPLLTVDAIHWTVTEGTEQVEIDPGEIFVASGPTAAGARIYVRPRALGDALLTAQIGDMEASIAVTVIE